MPATDLPGWRLTFNDDFNQNVSRGSFPSAVSSKWSAYPSPWKDTSRNGTYSPEIVSQANGLLDVWLHTENGVHKVAALMPKTGDMLYGRYAIRFKSDPVPGYKTAWLLWPQSGVWPRDGEIDFPEGDLDSTISAFMHRDNATSGGDQDAFSTSARYTSWHTAVIEWSPGKVRFLLDDVVIGTSTNRVPDQAMHWVIQTETALDGTVPPDSAQGHLSIDWVAVWSYAP
jgi:hypothetical protein